MKKLPYTKSNKYLLMFKAVQNQLNNKFIVFNAQKILIA